ncbi:Conserved hypothetical secreted protein [Mycolicibacterium smegmatis MC2 155]|uniref:Conserved hypothetical secreted protein n=2 Tax=Mycolicibacterium smegmatis TaxID=1772 RepID=I7G0K6_MYCS2|nr:Conserved hypothetical secreted protein [Mycolicibacterium smegmatis MC2 155]
MLEPRTVPPSVAHSGPAGARRPASSFEQMRPVPHSVRAHAGQAISIGMRTRRPAVSHRVRLTGPAGAVVMVLTVAACAGGASDRTATSTGVPDPDPIPPGVAEAESFPASVHPAVPDPRIGALFLGGGPVHTCTGTVLDSRTQDLVLTAAHCLADGVDTTFVPGFDPAAADTDPWHVTAIYLDPRWLADQDEQADFAIVRVTRHDGTTIEQQVGGGLALASAPAAGTAVAVTGYLVGEGGALTCRGVTTMADDGFPSLECAGGQTVSAERPG